MAKIRLIETLGDAIHDRRRVWAFCAVCGRTRIFNPLKLADRFGREARLKEIQARFRCTGCERDGGVYLVPEALARLYITSRMTHGGPQSTPPRVRDLAPDETWWVHCETHRCGHSRLLSVPEMQAIKARVHPDFIFVNFNKRFKCTKCGKRGGSLRYNNPHAPKVDKSLNRN